MCGTGQKSDSDTNEWCNQTPHLKKQQHLNNKLDQTILDSKAFKSVIWRKLRIKNNKLLIYHAFANRRVYVGVEFILIR